MSALHLTFAVDPGFSGAIAILADGKFEAVIDMPTMARASKGNEIDGAALAAIFRKYRAFHPGSEDMVVIEQVNAMPPGKDKKTGVERKMGSSSAFNFGEGFGVIKGVVQTLALPMTFVYPQRWKSSFGLIGRDKDVARTLAIQRIPAAADLLKRKKDIGRADALLIAMHAYGVMMVGHREAA